MDSFVIKGLDLMTACPPEENEFRFDLLALSLQTKYLMSSFHEADVRKQKKILFSLGASLTSFNKKPQ